MTRSRLALLLAAGGAIVVPVAVVVLSTADRASPRREAFEPAAASSRIAIGATSQEDLRSAVPLSVRVNPPAGFQGTVRAAIARAGERPWPIAASTPVQRSGRQRIAVQILPEVAQRLEPCASRQLTITLRNDEGAAVARRTSMLPGVPPRCGRFFGSRSVWTRPIPDDSPVDKLSGTLVAQLAREVRAEFARGFPPTINTTSYSAPVYTVPADQRRVPVRLVGSRASYGGKLRATLAAGVPIPSDARPSAGSDKHIVIWQPATDTMWELWVTERRGGTWTAHWGGRMDRVSRSSGYFSDPSGIQPGATASSLPLIGGLITQADLARGSINHALAMAMPNTRYAVWSVPAQRSDGGNRSPQAIPQGARFRLDPKVDVDSLGLPPFTAMLARAAQRYGIYVRDTSPVVTLYAQDPLNLGGNPWPSAITPSAPAVLRAFPWERLQVVPMQLFTYSGKAVAH